MSRPRYCRGPSSTSGVWTPRSSRARSLRTRGADSLLVLLVVDFYRIAICDIADRVVRSGDDLVARLQARHDFEILVTGNAHLDRHEFDGLGLVATNDEDTIGFLPCLARFQFGRGGHRLERASA